MPGIVGLITKKPRGLAEPELHRMMDAMGRESFYRTGMLVDESLGLYAGWTVRENSFADGMPVRNEGGDIALIFSGEEFPDPAAVQNLRSRGHHINSGSASYLVHVYEEDPKFPASLNGRFQGLMADCRRGTVTLFNDRYAMHKLYYYESDDAFYFSVEAKAILKVRPELRSVDIQSMAEMIVGSAVLENRSIFERVPTLPPASKWVFQHGSIARRDSYFQPKEWEDQERLTAETYYQELLETFTRILPRYFDGPEQIGVALTGGLDTRMIMAWQRLSQGSLPCYTFGGTYRDCQDVIMARRVAEVCGQSHEVIPVNSDFLSRFPHYAERSVFLTDGTVRVGSAPDLYVQEKAREIAPVRISGTYGSEVLRGLAGFKPPKLLPSVFDPELLDQMDRAKQRFTALKSEHPVSFAVFHQTPMRGVDTLEQTQVAVRTPFIDNDVVRTAFRAPDMRFAKGDIFADSDACNRLIADGNPVLRDMRTDRGLAGKPGWGPTAVKWMLEFTFKAEYAYDYGMPQWLARIDHCFSLLQLERLFLGRHKFGHFRVWYRGPLAGYVREILLDPRTLSRPYLQRKTVEAIVHGHLKGNRNYTLEIHHLLTLELIHRLFLDQR
jgi:asparagine synthase (glutamine-hydrolysing)